MGSAEQCKEHSAEIVLEAQEHPREGLRKHPNTEYLGLLRKNQEDRYLSNESQLFTLIQNLDYKEEETKV